MKVLFFDLDNTLYPTSLGVVARIDRRINEYLHTRVGIEAAAVDAVRRRFWAEHGTTLRGLMIGHGVDADDYLEFVHDIDLDDLLKPDVALRDLLDRLPVRKIVFSNGSREHVRRVLAALGVEGSFETMIGLEDLAYVPKPAAQAFQVALGRAAATGAECALIDDLRTNLAGAKRLGMRTVWVAEADHGEATDEAIDHVVPSVHAIEVIFSSVRRSGIPPVAPRRA